MSRPRRQRRQWLCAAQVQSPPDAQPWQQYIWPPAIVGSSPELTGISQFGQLSSSWVGIFSRSNLSCPGHFPLLPSKRDAS